MTSSGKASKVVQTVSVESIFSTMEGTIVRTEQMTELEKFFEIRLEGGQELGNMPGQFVQMSILGIGEAPISVSSSPTKKDKSTFEVCVRKVGVFTSALHTLDVGDKIGIRGPYGKGMPIDLLKGNDLLIIAGGIGIVPLRSLINFVIDKRRDFGKVNILLGCKMPKDMLFRNELERWNSMTDLNYTCTVDQADPDWKGNVGLITSLIPGVDIDAAKTCAAVIGPPIMYKFVLAELLQKGLPAKQIIFSLERRMKCGVGKCGHCQINDKYVCQDGPTFTFEDIRELGEAI